MRLLSCYNTIIKNGIDPGKYPSFHCQNRNIINIVIYDYVIRSLVLHLALGLYVNCVLSCPL